MCARQAFLGFPFLFCYFSFGEAKESKVGSTTLS